MKILTAILSIYFLGLSFAPCADTASEGQQTVLVGEQGHQNENHTDFCAPFCICQCCHTLVTFEKAPSFSSESPVFQTTIFSKKDFFQKGFLDPLLQPPQV